MPWSGSGVFTRLRSWVADKNNGIKIVSSLHDQEDDNLATGIQACITKNNESKPTADFKPDIDNSFSIGSASLKWLNAFFAGAIRFFNGPNYGELQAGTLTANRTYTLPDSSGTIVLEDGSNIVRNISGIAIKNGSFETVAQSITLSANRAISIPDDSGTLVLDTTSQDLKNKSFGPEGTGAGQAGAIRFKELVANGAESVGIRAPDSISTSYTLTLPNNIGAAGTTLSNDGTGLLSWQIPGSVFGPIGTNAGDAGRIQLQELSANGTEVTRIKASDNISASYDLTLPAALPITNGAAITFTTSGVGSFTTTSALTFGDYFIFQLLGVF